MTAASVYYLQVYAYYQEAELPEGALRLAKEDGTLATLAAGDVQAIDADSSPLRFRACFTLADPDAAILGATPYPGAEPLNAPGWFDCFDAREIGEALASGAARAWLGEKNVEYGVDRVVALFADGRAFAWHQLNNCGQRSYDGSPVGETCPPREETK